MVEVGEVTVVGHLWQPQTLKLFLPNLNAATFASAFTDCNGSHDCLVDSSAPPIFHLCQRVVKMNRKSKSNRQDFGKIFLSRPHSEGPSNYLTCEH